MLLAKDIQVPPVSFAPFVGASGVFLEQKVKQAWRNKK
jgi:hypothetical protein